METIGCMSAMTVIGLETFAVLHIPKTILSILSFLAVIVIYCYGIIYAKEPYRFSLLPGIIYNIIDLCAPGQLSRFCKIIDNFSPGYPIWVNIPLCFVLTILIVILFFFIFGMVANVEFAIMDKIPEVKGIDIGAVLLLLIYIGPFGACVLI